jgi:hypothetical protein
MNRGRRKLYRQLREIRRERDYQIGLIQYANRPYTKRPARIYGSVLTTRKFMRDRRLT